jgi:hypothetical protein
MLQNTICLFRPTNLLRPPPSYASTASIPPPSSASRRYISSTPSSSSPPLCPHDCCCRCSERHCPCAGLMNAAAPAGDCTLHSPRYTRLHTLSSPSCAPGWPVSGLLSDQKWLIRGDHWLDYLLVSLSYGHSDDFWRLTRSPSAL